MKHSVGQNDRAPLPGSSTEAVPDPDGNALLSRGGERVREQREAVRGMFDRVSGRYDQINHLLSFGLHRSWRRRTVRRMGLRPDAAVLDVACGTADLALECAQTASAGSVTGVDFSERMLRQGWEKVGAVKSKSVPVRLLLGSAENLPFRDDVFDAAGAAFGIRNVPDRIQALREMARTVRHGGKVAVLEFSISDTGPLSVLVRLYLRFTLPLFGRLFSENSAYHYLSRSIGSFPEPDLFAREMEQAGLRDVRKTHLRPAPTWIFTGTV